MTIDDLLYVMVMRTGILLLLTLAFPTRLLAQQSSDSQSAGTKALAINAILGGLTSGTTQAVQRKPFWPAFGRGAAGGSLVYAGKRIVGKNRVNTAWAGRQLAAIGSSEIRNAAAGNPVLQTIVLPIGPARLYLNTRTGARHSKLDLSNLVAAAYLATKEKAQFDLIDSMVRGALIFDSPKGDNFEAGGVVSLDFWETDNPSDPQIAPSMAHELVHVIQSDFVSIAWGEPLEKWISSRIDRSSKIQSRVNFGVLNIGWAGLNSIMTSNDRPWEKEASIATGHSNQDR